MLARNSKRLQNLFQQNPEKLTQIPLWARTEKIPTSMRVVSIATSIPLIAGGIGVHIAPETEKYGARAREFMDMTLNYGAAFMVGQCGITYGLQAARFGNPAKFKAMLCFTRAIVPWFSVLLGTFSVRMAMDMGTDAPWVMIVGLGMLWNLDYLFHKAVMQPTWMARWRWASLGAALASMGMCLVSEQMLILGVRKEIY